MSKYKSDGVEPSEAAIDAKAARAAIDADCAKRENSCLDEIRRICERYQCDLIAQAMIVQDGRIAARPVIVARGRNRA